MGVAAPNPALDFAATRTAPKVFWSEAPHFVLPIRIIVALFAPRVSKSPTRGSLMTIPAPDVFMTINLAPPGTFQVVLLGRTSLPAPDGAPARICTRAQGQF